MVTHCVGRAARALLFSLAVCITAPSHAALFRSYLALTGNDANPCTVQLPCRLLPAALAAVNDGGEIWMLDSANFNTAPVNINKSVKILAIPGQMGSIVGNGGDAIVINTAGDVTLRNLQVLNLAGGVNGVNILSAAAVHIEKTSIDGFRDDGSSCVRLDTANAVRLYIDDSFLRQCRNGVFANGSAVTGNASSILIDNTRIERGFNTASPASNGVWMKGFVDVTLRNSVISRQDAGIRFENPLGGGVSHLVLIHSEITRTTGALVYSNTNANAVGQISITDSQLLSSTDLINVSNSGVGGNVQLIVSDSHIAYSAGNGVTLSNSAGDANTRVFLSAVRSEIKNVTTAVSLSATNGSKTYLMARDVQIAHATTGVKTAGSSPVDVSLIRSNLNNLTTAIDHGSGKVRLDGSHVVKCANDFVNNGSGAIESLGNNMVLDNDNASALTYITPSIIAAK